MSLTKVTPAMTDGLAISADLASIAAGKGVDLVGGAARTLLLKDYGGVCDGVASDTAAIRAMLAAAEDGDICRLTDGGDQIVGLSDDGGGDAEALFTISKNITLELGGVSGKAQSARGPYIKLLGDISKSIFKIDGAVANQPSVTIDLGFSGYVNGTTRRSVAGYCVMHKAGDVATYRRLFAQDVAGGVLQLIRAVKCDFSNINIQTCGATGYSPVYIGGTDPSFTAVQGSTFNNVRVENTVNALAMFIGAYAFTNKFYGLVFEASGSVIAPGDFGYMQVDGFNNQFFGVSCGTHDGITSATAKILDNGQANQWVGISLTDPGTVASPSVRSSGDGMRIAGNRTFVRGVQGLTNAGAYDLVAVRTVSGSTGVSISDVYCYQSNPLVLGGDYGTATNIKTELSQGTAVDVTGFGNKVTQIMINGARATAAPIIRVSGVDCSVQGSILNANPSSTATAGVQLTSTAQRAKVDFDINGSCTALGDNRIAHGVLCEANDTDITLGLVRQIGGNVARYANVRVGSLVIRRAESWGFQAANTYATVEKTGATIAYGGSIRIGNLYPPSGSYPVAQTNWLKVLDNAGAPSWQNLYAYADCAPGLTASITASASNVIGQGVT